MVSGVIDFQSMSGKSSRTQNSRKAEDVKENSVQMSESLRCCSDAVSNLGSSQEGGEDVLLKTISYLLADNQNLKQENAVLKEKLIDCHCKTGCQRQNRTYAEMVVGSSSIANSENATDMIIKSSHGKVAGWPWCHHGQRRE